MILEVQNLKKSFRHPWTLQPIPVIKDLSFQIPEKTIVGFLGSNGAGKTTTIKCILNLLTYNSGDIQILGQHHNSSSVRKQIGFLPERPYFYNYLTAEEFLKFYGQLSLSVPAKTLKNRIDELLEMVGLAHAKKQFLREFSKGMLQRVGMAQAIIHQPKLLILDEPLAGLDPDGRMQMSKVIRQIRDMGTTVFFSSHLLDDVDRLCQHLVVIRKGELAYSGEKEGFVYSKNQSFHITYQLEDKYYEEDVENLGSLQKRIDELRGGQAHLLDIRSNKPNLEEAFREINQ